jgi:hypothetical protein
LIDGALAGRDAAGAADETATTAFSCEGDDQPWDSSGEWPEFDAFLAKLAGMGYSPESPNALRGWADDDDAPGETGSGTERLSTPEWARAVAASTDEPDGVRMDLDDDPFAHVARGDEEASEWRSGSRASSELTYSNKKRLLLEFARDRDDAFDRLSERELYVLADHPMPPHQGNSSGRKQVNALKRLRAHLGIDDGDLRGRCAAADHDQTAMGAVKLSDVLRLALVYAEDVAAKDRPPRAVMQSLLRRLSALADAPRGVVSATRGGGADAEPKQPRWVRRRERPGFSRPEFEEDRYAPSRGDRGDRGGRGGRDGRGGRGERRGFDRGAGDGYARGGSGDRFRRTGSSSRVPYEDDDDFDRRRRVSRDDDRSFGSSFGYGQGYGRGRGRAASSRFDDRSERFDRNDSAYASEDGWDTRPPRRDFREREDTSFASREGRSFASRRSDADRDGYGGDRRGGGRGRFGGRGERGRGSYNGSGSGGFERRTRSSGGFGSDFVGLDLAGGDPRRSREFRSERGDRDFGGSDFGGGGGERGRGGGRGGERSRGRGRGAERGRGGGGGGGRGSYGDREGGFAFRGGGRGSGYGEDRDGDGGYGGYGARPERGSRFDRAFTPRGGRGSPGSGGANSPARGGGGQDKIRLWRPGHEGVPRSRPDRSGFGDDAGFD